MQLAQSGGTEELERFHAAVGGRGTIGGPYFRKPDQYTRKPQYRWIAYAKMAREAYALIEPYLCSVKRAQAEQALKALEEERK